MKDRVAYAGGFLAAGLGYLIGAGLIAFIVVGGMFYRTDCPSGARWDFNPIPFVHVVSVNEQACETDTGTGYYTGKVPVIGKPLRSVVKSFTGQDQDAP